MDVILVLQNAEGPIDDSLRSLFVVVKDTLWIRYFFLSRRLQNENERLSAEDTVHLIFLEMIVLRTDKFGHGF